MIRAGGLIHITGLFLLVLAASMTVPLAYGVFAGSDGLAAMGWSAGATAVCGGCMFAASKKPSSDLSVREGVLLVVAAWVLACLFGALPFVLSPQFPSVTDAVFESASGFSTTGATILPDVEVLPPAIQFWRHFTHWLGGMGIVLLGIAILPLLGTGGMHLYRAEFSGAKSEKLKPRITETALALYRIYVALTLAEYALLRLAGMNSFEAICHAFSTMGTGGFSTRTASVAAFDSPWIEAILIVFMLFAGTNFTMHYRLWVERRVRVVARDPEVRAYFAVYAIAVAVVTLSVMQHPGGGLRAFRDAAFNVASIMTCTGFASADYELWLPLPQLMMLALMFFGGCTGSTSGGFKASRVVLLWKVIGREFKRMVERRGVFAIRLGEQVIPEPAIQSLLNLVYLALMVNFVASLLLTAMGVDILTSISAVAACMFNAGPGLGEVGPTNHYGVLPGAAKWVLCGVMLAGRLEFYTLLVLLSPAFWRK